jgi:hypothetical protein
MVLEKKSAYSQFMSAMVVQMTQIGLNNVLYDRHRVAKPNCNPILIPTNSLGMTKLASLFVIIVTGMILAFLIFLVEKFIKVHQNNPNQCNSYTAVLDTNDKIGVLLENLSRKKLKLPQFALEYIQQTEQFREKLTLSLSE